jgi:hypothetical protein
MTLPSNRKVAWTYDTANWVSSAAGTPSGGPAQSYAASVQYASQGDISQYTLGSGLVEVRKYDAYRQQPIGVTLGINANDSSRLALGFAFCPGATPPASCTTNDGNLQSQMIGPLGATQSYMYDTLNRLNVATEKTSTTTNWSETFNYDQFGNRWVNPSTGISLSPLTPIVQTAYSATTNHLTLSNFGYDPDGNQTFNEPVHDRL